MAIAGQTFVAAQVSSILVGAFVPVLAWRLAADTAQELELPVGRARTLAVGAGLTTAIYLPLLLHSSLPDSTMVFTALALGLLVEEQKIAWEAPVVRYLPWFRLSDPYVTRELTVRDLLVHRSGLGLGAGDLLWWPPSTYTP